ncbi:hypothetical protein L195_g004039 [Trifolium pratense]|uniref:Uncharacterized protein n=1 Tax=Trifolium pratense TaxID=57577 RepID=A0A2K3NWY0_TRIPR|nr:hypothetical protein L195_g004039 [Trifolium pratense]
MPPKPIANLTKGEDKKDDDEDQVYLDESKTAAVNCKGKVILKLTSGEEDIDFK